MIAIKICGITRVDDAEAAAALQVNALGFVMWPGSPRALETARVAAIVAALPLFVIPVGVFVDPSTDDLRRAVEVGGIQVAQVHGRTPPLDGIPVRILPSVHLGPANGTTDPDVPGAGVVHLDAVDQVLRGGTGRTIDWPRAASVAAVRPVILAGGLTPGNVGDAIRVVSPYGVDVSSGVEASPGVKDHARLREFVAAVRRAS